MELLWLPIYRVARTDSQQAQFSTLSTRGVFNIVENFL